MCALLLGFCLVLNLSTGFVSAEDDVKKLQNGSFERHNVTSWLSGCYAQPKHNDVPYWNTTAYNSTGTNGLIELFKENSSTYLQSPNVTLKPSNGEVAAELNAEEESTLYQVVSTSPSSIYEWGLDHGARTTKDVMALVIGPAQSENPSKPSKTGRDQFMQMVDWLNSDTNSSIKDEISAITAGAEPKQYTVYSKKFAASGTFADNTGNNAFSLTPSTIYTEEWHIWIMASSRSTTAGGENPWNSYGSNAEGSAGSGTSSGSTEVDTSKYYLYTVPEGQTRTLFGFVSISSVDKGPTFGNFLDNINFDIYHPLSGSTSTHGSAVVGGSDGTTEGGGTANSGHTVTVNDKLATYVTDGESLKIQAIIKKADADAGCEFVGVYYTTQDENGDPKTVFLQLAGKEIEDTGSLTDGEKKDKWVKSTNTNGDIIYTYYLESITSATDLHFVFIKSPTITYDPNGGKAYVVERTYNTDEAANVYSYKPDSGHNEAQAGTATIFIDPYVSKAAEGPDDAPEGSWKFMGWKLTGDTVDANLDENTQPKVGALEILLPAVHTIACDYHFDGVTLTDGSKDTKAQYFKIYDGNVTLSKTIDKDAADKDTGVTWTDNGATKTYANVHKGLTMVAQWRWRQAFIPQVGSGTNYTDSANGGTVEITSVTDTSDANYNAAYNANGGKSYHAETDETITATATAKDGFTFKGWYDANGNLITTNATYSYTETQESVNTYYARFSGSVTQTYIRQVKSENSWTVIEGTDTSPVGTLGRYTYTDAAGMPISSTATAGTGYTFVGWYDSNGHGVAPSMLINGGATISYTTTGNATYYARFIREGTSTVTQTYVRQVKNGNNWEDTTNNAVGTLDCYSYTDVRGTSISSTATAGAGYKFEGWYDSTDNKVADTMLINNGATISYTTTGDATYYARFSAIGYTVAFASNGGTGTMDSQPFVYGTDQNLNANTFSRDGYTFTGWNTEADGSGTAYADGAFVNNLTKDDNSTVTLYAQWSPITYKVKHYQQNLNDDGYTIVAEDTETLQGTTGATVSATPKSYTGFTENTTHPDRAASGLVAADGSLVLKLYYDRELCTVTYDLNGGSTTSSQTVFTDVKYGAATPTIAEPTLEGFVFMGWSIPITANVTGDVTYTALFEADQNTDGIPDSYQVFVRYEAGANGSLEGRTYAVYDLQPSVELTFPTPTADSGYRFSNWTEPRGVTVTNSTMSGLTAGETYTFTANFVRNDVPPVTPEGPGDPGSGDPGPSDPPISPSTPVLNTEDHYSYIIGYKDGTLRPYGTITRGEVATIFFRLLTDETRQEYWSQTNNYSDCNSELWCNNAISTLSSIGIIDGFEDGTFRPYAKITRAQFAKIAVGFFETTKEDYEGFFTDVSIGAWYTEYVEAAARAGLIRGFENGTFRPNSNITRAQACVIVNRALNRKPDEEHLLDEDGMLTWVDNNPGDWFYADMQEATNSHDYIWLTEEREMIEQWTAKLPQRNWAALEHAWSTAHSAPGGEVTR